MLAARVARARLAWEKVSSRIVLTAAIALSVAAGTYLSVGDQGIYWPDEVMKSTEQAHRLVFGYGFVPWEFQKGANSWFFPAFLAVPMKLSALVGLGHPTQYLFVVRMTMVALTTATAYATYRLAKSYDTSDLYAAIAGAAAVLAAPVVYFGSRALTETASMFVVALGLALSLEKDASRRRNLTGVLLIALSVFLRVQNAIFPLGVLLIWAFRKDKQRVMSMVVAFGVAAFAFGLLDFLTWHRWFNSAIEYARFTFSENGASGWGVAGHRYYVDFFRHSLGPLAVVLASLVALSARKALGLVALSSVFLVAHSVVGHKEGRFIMPMFPLVCAMAAVGMEQLKRWIPGPAHHLAPIAVTVTLALSFAQFHHLTFGDVEQTAQPASASAYSFNEGINRLLIDANRREDICGLFVPGQYWSWTGGYSYLHRRIPFYAVGNAPPARDSYNYEIVEGSSKGGVAHSNNWSLVRTGDSCRPDPAYTFKRPG